MSEEFDWGEILRRMGNFLLEIIRRNVLRAGDVQGNVRGFVEIFKGVNISQGKCLDGMSEVEIV